MRMPALLQAPGRLGLAVAATLALPLGAQTVRVRALAGDPPRPVAGALLSLQTQRGERVAQTLTDESGRATLTAPAPGTYRVRADRIGYSGTVSDPFAVSADAGAAITVLMPDTRVLLPELTVQSTRRVCRIARESGTALATVWDEARKALTGTRVTRTVLPPELDVTMFERDLDRDGRITAERSSSGRRRVSRPFVAPDPDGLLERGFAEERDGEVWVAAPDEELLLSDAFVESHCFWVVSGSGADTGLVGLAFEPARGRRVPEIQGTLWLDRGSGELRHLQFSYVNLDDRFTVGDAGGRIEFRRLPTGGWIVSEWAIRTPIIARIERRTVAGWPERRDSLLGRRETGGRAEVVRLDAPVGRAVLTGIVFDSTAGAPLVGAVVSIGGGSYVDTTGPSGRFRIETPTRGDFLVTADHPLMRILLDGPLTAAARLDRGGVTTLDLAIPPLDRLGSRLCANLSVAGGGTAILTGFLRDSIGATAPGASVTLRFRGPGPLPVNVTATADEQGRYRLCGLSRSARIWLAGAGDLEPTPRSIELAGRDLTVADVILRPARRGTLPSTITVSVRDSASGNPVAGALLVLHPSGDTARTAADGTGRLPSGGAALHTLLVWARGYATVQRDVEIATGSEAVAVTLSPHRDPAIAQEGPTPGVSPRLAGFWERRMRGVGRFFSPDDLRVEQRSPLSGLLRKVPGLRLVVRPSPCSGFAAAAGRPGSAAPGATCQGAPFPAACFLAVYLDGTVFWRQGTGEPPPDVDDFRVDDLEAVEVYGQAQLPAEFLVTGAACGALVLWRRATGP